MNLRATRLATIAVALLGANASTAYATGHAVDTSGNLFEIDVNTASEVLIGPTGITELIESIAGDANGNLYVTTVSNSLYRVDAASGAATLVGVHGGDLIEGLDFRDGTMIGVEFRPQAGTPQRLVALSAETAAGSTLAILDRSDILSISALAIADRRTAYFHGALAAGVGTLFSVDIDAGTTTLIGDLSQPLAAMDFDGRRLIGLGFGGKVFEIDPATAAMEQIGTTNGTQAWLGLTLAQRRVSILECGDTGSGGDTPTFRHIRFRTDSAFDGVQLRLEATAPGDYFFDAELRRADGISVQAERNVPVAAIGLGGNFATPPYRPVTIDFGEVAVAGLETFTVSLKNVSGPGGTLVFETYGFGNEPCVDVEEIDTSSTPPSVVGDPAGFRLLTSPDRPAPLLVCEMPGLMNGDNASSRGVRFTTNRDFASTELRFNAFAAGGYTFDVELRRSSGFLGTPERVVSGLTVDVPGGLNVQPFRVVSVDFGQALRVLGAETFTLKITNISGPGALLFETYGIGTTPCPNVQETEQNNVAVPTERGDPAGFRLLGGRDQPLPVLACNTIGSVAFNAAVRGVRFVTTEPFTAIELRMESSTAGVYAFDAELRRSGGFVVAAERVVPGVDVAVQGNLTSHPYAPIARIELGNEPVAPGTFTLKLVSIAGPSGSLFLDVDASPCPDGDVVGTLDNTSASPIASGSPAGFRLQLLPDADLDGVTDLIDNCVLAANASQLDSDEDGIGNRCDGDFNNDCQTNALDLGVMRDNFFQPGERETDMNGDGVTNPIDLGMLRSVFFTAPGPAAPPSLCQ